MVECNPRASILVTIGSLVFNGFLMLTGVQSDMFGEFRHIAVGEIG